MGEGKDFIGCAGILVRCGCESWKVEGRKSPVSRGHKDKQFGQKIVRSLGLLSVFLTNKA